MNNDLNSGMNINLYIYAKCEGITAMLKEAINEKFASSATL